jgi:hypothetical protein
VSGETAVGRRRRALYDPRSLHFREAGPAQMSRTLIIIGLVVVAIGILWPWLARIGFGRLPGDILIVRENFTIYIPITSGLIVSVPLTAVLWLIYRH